MHCIYNVCGDTISFVVKSYAVTQFNKMNTTISQIINSQWNNLCNCRRRRKFALLSIVRFAQSVSVPPVDAIRVKCLLFFFVFLVSWILALFACLCVCLSMSKYLYEFLCLSFSLFHSHPINLAYCLFIAWFILVPMFFSNILNDYKFFFISVYFVLSQFWQIVLVHLLWKSSWIAWYGAF